MINIFEELSKTWISWKLNEHKLNSLPNWKGNQNPFNERTDD